MKKMRRILALALALMLVFSAVSLVGAAEETSNGGQGRVVDGYDPIPLLVIKVNFETDGIEGDCFEVMNEDGERTLAYNKKLKDKPQYGEQYCYSSDKYWSNLCFSDEPGSLNDYYKYISNGKFYWIPVEETYGTENDGVISVIVNAKHPGINDGGDLSDGNERKLAVQEADKYVDFSKYDKNDDGLIDFTELTIVYVYGGYEVSYNAASSIQYTYGTHAHVSSVQLNLEADGVQVYKDAQRYVRLGEYRGGFEEDNKWVRMGKLAHELGHVLDAKDLYIDSADWIGGCGELSLMGGSSNGMNGNISSPALLDPYYRVRYGFSEETVASSGTNEYTLYSPESTEGDFNVIRINTPNPNEYYLLENRSHSDSGYDNNGLNGNMQGILIWHIDENIIGSHARPNNGNEGHAPGFTVITPTNATFDVDESSTWSSSSEKNVFLASNEAEYKFMVSTPDNIGSWYTSLTEEQAAQCNIKVEFLTEAGNEMKIRVSGAADLPVEIMAGVSEKTQESLTIMANISDYNGSAVTGCKFLLSTSSDMSNAMTQTVEVGAEVKFNVTFTGLKENTEYFYVVEMETTHGKAVSRTSSTYTSSKPVEKTKATVTLVVNSDLHKTTTVKVNVGEAFSTSIPLTKKGYTFGGWYTDEACTQAYEAAPLETADDFTLYAKWVEDAAQNTTVRPTEPDNTTTAPVATPTDPNGNNGGISTTTIVIIVVAAVVVIGGAAAVAIVLVNKKKTK